MKLHRVIIEGFRGYQQRIEVPVTDLTAIVGKNEAGKSSILEALEIFFNNKTVKIDADDGCKKDGCDRTKVRIGCVFDDLPEKVVLDAACETSFVQEELLNSDGMLEIHKVFNCRLKTPKVLTFAVARHRLMDDGSSLLKLKNTELKKSVKGIGAQVEDNKKNPLLRAALRERLATENKLVEISMDEGNCEAIMKEIAKRFPIFALFQSDRPSTDSDSEVQDPVKVAIEEAIKAASHDLDKAEQLVKEQVEDVLNRTLAKLNDMDPSLAKELKPRIETPKWKNAFSVKLDSDEGVPLNKRGSGVRRLILLNFFRAEAERRRADASADSVIYAIEEPETSQHPNNQRMLIDAFLELADSGTAQVLLTTHVPGLAGMVPVSSIRFVETDDSDYRIVKTADDDSDDLLREVAETLGVIPDSRVKVLFCVEGPNDVEFFCNVSRTLAAKEPDVPNLRDIKLVAFVPLGGQTLEQWVKYHYLSALNRPEFHVYDGDYAADTKIKDAVTTVNQRGDCSKATVLTRRSAESYLHGEAIKRCCRVEVEVKEGDCVATIVSEKMTSSGQMVPLGEGKQAKPHKNIVKRLLNGEVAAAMTVKEWKEADPAGELLAILRDLNTMLSQ